MSAALDALDRQASRMRADQVAARLAQMQVFEVRDFLEFAPERLLADLAMQFARLGCEPLLRWALFHGADIEHVRGDGESMLWRAVEGGRAEAVEWLLAQGAAVESPKRKGTGPLHLAASNNDARCARALLRGGADPARRTSTGETAFDVACDYAALECVQLLASPALWPDERARQAAARAKLRHLRENMDEVVRDAFGVYTRRRGMGRDEAFVTARQNWLECVQFLKHLVQPPA